MRLPNESVRGLGIQTQQVAGLKGTDVTGDIAAIQTRQLTHTLAHTDVSQGVAVLVCDTDLHLAFEQNEQAVISLPGDQQTFTRTKVHLLDP